MSFQKIYGAGTPLSNINGSLVNVDNSHVAGIPISSNVYPNGPYTLPPAGSNVQGAAGIYPCSLKGGKINKNKINKISRKYKMMGTKSKRSRHIKRTIRRIKSRVLKKRSSRRNRTRGRGRGRGRKMRGGTSSRNIFEGNPRMRGGAHAAVAPNYPAGWNQYDNNKVFSNTFSTGGPIPPQLSALASPPPYTVVKDELDNLNHAAPNAYGNYGAGSGFPSRGWF